MKHLVALFLVAICVASAACGANSDESSGGQDAAQAGSSLPEGVPSDLPFPDGADLDVTTSEMSGAKQHVISFSFSESAESVYQDFKSYATSNGYTIAMEDEGNYRFSAVGEASRGLVVDVSDMGSVSIGTVTVSVPAE